MAVDRADVGCWIVKCNPATGTDYFGMIDAVPPPNGSTELHADNWCLSPRSGRSVLVEPGDRVALWVTGAKNPGIYEFGWVTDNRSDDAPGDRKLHYQAVRLGRHGHIPRSVLQETPALARCEQLRAPMMSNPSYLTVGEARALAALIADRRPAESVRAARWAGLLE